MVAIAAGRTSPSVAVMAMVGGFVTPVLVSTGRDAQVELFSYLALHNAALLVLARTDAVAVPRAAGVRSHAARTSGPGSTASTRATGSPARSRFPCCSFVQFSALPVASQPPHRDGPCSSRPRSLVDRICLPAGAARDALARSPVGAVRGDAGLAALSLIIARGAASPRSANERLPRRRRAGPTCLAEAGLWRRRIGEAALCRPGADARDGRDSARARRPGITLAWSVEAAVLMWTGFETRPLAPARGVVRALRLGRPSLGDVSDRRHRVSAERAIRPVARDRGLRAGRASGRCGGRRRRSGVERLWFAVLAVGANVLLLVALTDEVGCITRHEASWCSIWIGAWPKVS